MNKTLTKKELLEPIFKTRYKDILTNEDWLPTMGGVIRVSLHHDRVYHVPTKTFGKTIAWRVAIWGADDFGLEHEYNSKAEAESIFNRIVDFTTQDQLRSWGFMNA